MKALSQRDSAQLTLSREVGHVVKPHGDRLRVALSFPNSYFVGMSNLGLQTMYKLFNAREDTVCERFFLPAKQELAALLESGARVVTLESQTPVRDFDVIAFSVSFEWDYTNVLTLLRLAGIPLRAADRDYRHPLVVIGGAVTFVNPEPLAMFADVIAAGEGESLVGALVDACGTPSRSETLRRLAAQRGFYIPSFYDVEYNADGTIARYVPREGTGAPPTIRKAALKTTEACDPPATSIFTPDTEFGSRFLVEVVRGCANLCRFCWAGYNYLPVRAFPTDRILQLAQDARQQATKVGLVSIALCDHPDIEHILRSMQGMGYSISPASLRLDDLTPTIVTLLKESGERTLTIAPETGSDRLRRVINKTVTNEEILASAELIFSSGIENLKLYYMIGLPSEDDEDLVAIRDLTIQLRDVMLKHARSPRPHRPHRRQREPAGAEAGDRLSVDGDGSDRRHRAQDEAAARAGVRHRQRLLQHQERAAFLLSGAAVAGRPAHRAGYRAGRAERRPVAPGRQRRRPRWGLLHLPRSLERHRAAVGHHRRRHEGVVLPLGARQERPRRMDAAGQAIEGKRTAPARADVASSSSLLLPHIRSFLVFLLNSSPVRGRCRCRVHRLSTSTASARAPGGQTRDRGAAVWRQARIGWARVTSPHMAHREPAS